MNYTLFYPNWLSLFHPVTTLSDALVIDQLHGLERSVELPIVKYQVLHIGAVTSKANAWVSGILGKHSVLLSDTLLESCSPAEIKSIVAHEFGHVHNHDLLKRLILRAVLETGGLLLLYKSVPDIFEFEMHSITGVFQFGVSTGIVIVYSAAILLAIARKQEIRADEFALRVCDPVAFGSAMRKLKQQNLITYGKKEEINYSHPAMDERIRRAEEIASKAQIGSAD
ncbi:MAG: M48 family metalloprotease [Acidobacteriales bacterium]|nr:M48 family metalloprotease [Terriglobales bacterium]